MISSEIRTDLALEAHESIRNTDSCKSLHGVTVSEYDRKKSHTHITEVNVTTRNGAKAIGKPMGTYITIEAPRMVQNDEGCHREISAELARQLKKLIPGLQKEQSVLVIGLGNRDVTADALGPAVVDHLCITRHIIREYGKAAYNKEKMHEISALAPGVMAKNGMETAEIIRGVVKQTKPDVMIVIDALAARSTKRLNSTIQLTDTGIQPGSGVGNHRNGLTEETIGIPVIAIGVPTVVDAATIVISALESIESDILLLEQDNPVVQKTFHDLYNMYVTSKDIDETIKRLSFTISEALNIALSL